MLAWLASQRLSKYFYFYLGSFLPDAYRCVSGGLNKHRSDVVDGAKLG